MDAPRLIPAHAGKTRHTWGHSQSHPAHPRSRGENARDGRRPRSDGGSSPLTRGKPSLATRAAVQVRLIPAHAGKTSIQTPSQTVKTAHPRSRGENGPTHLPAARMRGSSPLTRGKLNPVQGVGGRVGLIPAHAGKTPRRIGRGCGSRAHPRSRGENCRYSPAVRVSGGSSPLTRGKRLGSG